MTGVGVSWSAPTWVGLSDEDYSDLIRKKAVAVTRRDKRRDGKYSVKEAIEASIASLTLYLPSRLLSRLVTATAFLRIRSL